MACLGHREEKLEMSVEGVTDGPNGWEAEKKALGLETCGEGEGSAISSQVGAESRG